MVRAEVACSIPLIVRDHIDEVRRGLRNRGLDPDKALEEIATLETARRRLIPEVEGLKRQQNTVGRRDRAGEATGPGHGGDSGGEPRARAADQAARAAAGLHRAPARRGAAGRCRTCRTRACRSARARPTTWRSGATASRARSISTRSPHWDLGPALGIIDFERGTKVAGGALLGAERRRRAALARADQLHARPAHARARLPRDRAAVSGQQRVAARHRQPARSSRRICSRSPATGICI